MNHITRGVSVAAVNADSDEILNRYAMTPQIPVTANATGQLSPSKTPREVATPLPPLKRKNIGYKCPIKAKKATSASVFLSDVNACAIRTGIRPLSMSPMRVIMAAFFPAMRNTLVAPGLFEPCDLGSGRPNNLHVMIAVDTDPSK